MLCLLGSVAAFAATREKPSVAVARVGNHKGAPQVNNSLAVTIKPASAESNGLLLEPREPAALANLQPLSESTSFRLLWVAAGLALILVLRRRQRRRA